MQFAYRREEICYIFTKVYIQVLNEIFSTVNMVLVSLQFGKTRIKFICLYMGHCLG
jgi:hypothetical protein